MPLTPEEEAAFKALSEKATAVVKPSTLRDVLHFLVAHAGSGPVHDDIHAAIDGLDEPGPGPQGPEGPQGPPGKDAESPATVEEGKDDA